MLSLVLSPVYAVCSHYLRPYACHVNSILGGERALSCLPGRLTISTQLIIVALGK